MSDAIPGGEDTGRVHLIPALYRLAGETVKEKGRDRWYQGSLGAQKKKGCGKQPWRVTCRVFESQGSSMCKCRGEPLNFSLGSLLGAISREGETKRGLDAGGFWGWAVGGGGMVGKESMLKSRETDGPSLHQVFAAPVWSQGLPWLQAPFHLACPPAHRRGLIGISNSARLKLGVILDSSLLLRPNSRQIYLLVPSNLIYFSPFPLLFLWFILSTNDL